MYTRSPKELALYIAEQRRKLGLNQTELGDKVGVGQKTISAFENKPESTKLETLFKILSSCNLDLYIYKKEDDPVTKKKWDEEW